MPIDSRPDHVAIAVPELGPATARWHDELGGGYLEPRVVTEAAGFATCQLHYRGGGKLELLEPISEDGFAARFIRRFGAQVHHITLTVPELHPAVEELGHAGYQVVDVSTDDELWHEAFLRPSEAGGVLVQIARSAYTTMEWAEHWGRETGWVVEQPRPDGALLRGPTLGHPDLDAARRLWEVLGGEVDADADGLWVTWPDAALSIRIEQRDHAGPLGVRFDGTSARTSDQRLGAAVLAA